MPVMLDWVFCVLFFGFFGCLGSLEVTMRRGCRPLIEDKWSSLVVSMLGPGPKRFTELKRGLGDISQRMLTVTLRNLERDGIIVRSVIAVMPPHVEYRLTEMGITLLDSIQPMLAWGRENIARVEE